MRVLIAGWFSFPKMGASAGDLLCGDLVAGWFRKRGAVVDVCTAPPFQGGLDWSAAKPSDYAAVVFVCGPFGNGWPVTEFLAHFSGCRLIGVNLTMLQRLEEWNPFDLLVERDSSSKVRPDLVFLSPGARTPVAGLVLVHPQREYGDRGRHEQANQALRSLAARRGAAVVLIDTRLDENASGLTTPGQVDSLIARMDIVLTTRLHGLVLALRNGVPAVAIDPIAGGAKISRQAQAIGWPYTFTPDALNHPDLDAAFDACSSANARTLAAECAARACAMLAEVECLVTSAVAPPGETAVPS